ncbi:MAG: hypothetical protein ACR2GH_17800 [Pseudonocardia sp.]
MLEAERLERVLQRSWNERTHDPLGQRLISIIFARPTSFVWDELSRSCGFLDSRSGDAWDLFFAGTTRDFREMRFRENRRGGSFRSDLFNELMRDFKERERDALQSARSSKTPWKFSGGTDLVNLISYEGRPDWLSVKSIQLEGRGNGRATYTLAEITECLSEWESDGAERSLMPGELPHPIPDSSALERALWWSGNAVFGGFLGNAVYDLLKQLYE